MVTWIAIAAVLRAPIFIFIMATEVGSGSGRRCARACTRCWQGAVAKLLVRLGSRRGVALDG